MTALPMRVKGRITRVFVPTSTALVEFKDQHGVLVRHKFSLSRLYTSVTDSADVKAQEDDPKQLPPLLSCGDFVSKPCPSEFKDLLFSFETLLLRYFSKAKRTALRGWFSAAQPAEFDSPLAAPYNILALAFEAFDCLLLAAMMQTVQPAVIESTSLRLHAQLQRARAIIRTLLDGCRVKFWEVAALLWRTVRSPERAGGHRLMSSLLFAMEAAGAHSCLHCLLTQPEACSHACCAQQLLYLGRVRGTLLLDDGYWRVSPHAQEAASAELSPDAPSPAASPRPPSPVTWDKLRGMEFPVVLGHARHFFRITAQQDSCSFADLAFSVGLTVDGASTLRKQMASFITQRLKTQWLLSMFRESKVAVDGKQLSDAAAKVVKPGHPLTLFLVHVFSLLQHVDVYISSPVWDGAPLPADQIRRFHSKWKVAASEVLSEQKSPPKKMLLAHVSRHNPLSSSKRDVYVQTAFVEVCPAPR
jgi:hypothetical protein